MICLELEKCAVFVLNKVRTAISSRFPIKLILTNIKYFNLDVLYDLLNCTEHLELYAKLKDIPKNEIKSKVNSLKNNQILSNFFIMKNENHRIYRSRIFSKVSTFSIQKRLFQRI